MIPLALDVTLVLLGPVILVISLLLRVLLVLMVPRDLEFPLLLVVSHRLVVPSALLAGSPVSRRPPWFVCSLDPTSPPLGSVVPLVSVIPHDLVFPLISLDLVVPLAHMIPL